MKIRMFVPIHLTWVEMIVVENKVFQAEMDEMVVPGPRGVAGTDGKTGPPGPQGLPGSHM